MTRKKDLTRKKDSLPVAWESPNSKHHGKISHSSSYERLDFFLRRKKIKDFYTKFRNGLVNRVRILLSSVFSSDRTPIFSIGRGSYSYRKIYVIQRIEDMPMSGFEENELLQR